MVMSDDVRARVAKRWRAYGLGALDGRMTSDAWSGQGLAALQRLIGDLDGSRR
jgi:hypothetical protein